MITVTINGQGIKLEKPVTILEAANMLGIKIPVFCNYPGLEKYGGCRMCLVEIEKMPRLQTSCTLNVTDGMVVRTESEEIAKARKGTLEFLLINHPLDCPVCEKAGECELQDNTLKYGAAEGRFLEGKRKYPENLDDPLIARNTERCILCTRCIRMCDGVQGASALTIRARGDHSVVEPFSGSVFDCDYCGNCITVCPVGALLSKPHRHTYRPWQMEKNIKSVCGFCGVGCSMTLQVRSNKLIRTLPELGLGINNGILCSLGRFGYDYVQSSERLTKPLIRKDGKLEEASWDDALTMVAERLREIKSEHGSESIGGIASARCTNEENYLFQKLFRAGLGSNNIDSIANTGFGIAQRCIEKMIGKGSTANPISGIKDSDTIIVIGGDPVHITPVLGIQVRDAHMNGSKVITIGYTPGLDRFKTHGLSIYPFTEGTLLRAMLAELDKTKEKPGKNKDIESRIKEIATAPFADIEGICGIKGDVFSSAMKDISEASSISVVAGPDIVRRSDGMTNIFLLSCLSYRLNARLYLLAEKPNEQGLIDAGCMPDALPGGRPLDDEGSRKLCEDPWRCNITSTPGLTLPEMISASNSGSMKAMYIMGENPVYNLPDGNHIKSSLESLEFLVVQDIFMTETAEIADVVLPSMSWAEKDGTYTNLERRIQRLGKALEGDGMEDWKILAEIGGRIGVHMPYKSSSDIFNEISKVSPIHEGLTYSDIEKGTDLWPYKGKAPEPHSAGAAFQGIAASCVPAKRDSLYLLIERHMFHSGTMSRHSEYLNGIYKGPCAKISPENAKRLGITDGESVVIKSGAGHINLPLKTDKCVPDNMVVLTNYYKEKGGLSLVTLRIDPVTKALCLNGIEVTIEKAGQ